MIFLNEFVLMTFIFSVLFYLYVLFIILAIAALLFATPPIIERLPWLKEKSTDEKVLWSLPIHTILIILAVVSVWKFQHWRTDYAVRTGHADIAGEYHDFLVDEYPKLGKAYQRVLADKFMVDEHIAKIANFPRSLANHYQFVMDISNRWQMISDQLENLKGIIETKAGSHEDSYKTAIDLTDEIDASFQRIYRSKQRISDDMDEHVERSIRFLTNPRLNDNHYPVSKKNYDQLISFFLSEHSGSIDQLNLITQTILASNTTMGLLRNRLNQRNVPRRKMVYRILRAWDQTKKFARERLFKILYALETEYVLKRLGMEEDNPVMQRLTLAIPETIQRYSVDVFMKWQSVNQDSNPQRVLVSNYRSLL